MKTIRKFRFALFILFPALMSVSLINQSDSNDLSVDKIVNQTNKFRDQYTQQKVYLQTDKDIYKVGENVWMKAYLMDAMFLQADTSSKDLYVELLDQSQRVAKSLVLHNYMGSSEGFISLNDTLMEGNYMLRAYTSWMRNFDHDYYFFKTIRVKNPNYENVATKSRLKNINDFNSSAKKKETIYTVSFFPEGGNLVTGLPNVVAFKAENGLGLPLDIKGTVVDNKGTEVASFESIHDGMGTFKLIPKADINYTAKITLPNGKVKKYSLPMALPKGITMSVNAFGKEDVRVILKPSENYPATNIIIIAQSRGQLVYISKGEIKGKPIISTIPKKKFPTGISQITILDGQGEPICERLVFIQPEPEINTAKVDLNSVSRNDSVIYTIKVTPSGGNLSSGSASFSVVENLSNTSSAGNETILTNLLLTSDIKGYVYHPSYYFDSNNPKCATHLDLIMLTNGWRRFVWKEILADKFPSLIYSKNGGILISGSEYGDNFLQKPHNKKVVMSAPTTYYGTPSFTLKLGEDARNYTNTIDYIIGKIPGVVRGGNYILIGGVGTMNGGSDPLFILDGVNIGGAVIASTSPASFEKVEVFKGAEATIFGAYGANGALVFYSRRTNDLPKRISENVTSYQKTREFYIPPYELGTTGPEANVVPKTLYWKPNVSLNAKGEAMFRFKKKLASDKLDIILEGLTDSGEIVYKKVQD